MVGKLRRKRSREIKIRCMSLQRRVRVSRAPESTHPSSLSSQFCFIVLTGESSDGGVQVGFASQEKLLCFVECQKVLSLCCPRPPLISLSTLCGQMACLVLLDMTTKPLIRCPEDTLRRT
jgi:hypothetical protein